MTRIPEPTHISQADEHNWVFEMNISEDLPFFPGHFPDQSILPGVVIIDWAMELAQKHMGVTKSFASMEVIKFKKFVTPGQTITLALQNHPEQNKIRFKLTSSEGDHSSGKIMLS